MINETLIQENYNAAVSGIKEEWLWEPSSQWYNYIIELPLRQKVTYLIVILNEQVQNGGFDQYFSNAYGQFIKETIEALNLIGSKNKSQLLQKAFSILNKDNLSDFIFREKLITKSLEALFENDNILVELDELDSQYYSDSDPHVYERLSHFLEAPSA